MQNRYRITARKPLAFAAIAAATLPALAGIKYWDNSGYRAFDVDCYVPGAVWNYDGIRNVGADQPHSTTTTTWKNLGTGASSEPEVYLQRYISGSSWSAVTADELSAGTYGAWTENGFVFMGNGRMRRDSPGTINTGKKYTMQFLIDANANDIPKNTALVFNNNYNYLSFPISKSTGRLRWNTKEFNGENIAAFISGPSFDYATAIANNDTGTTVLFSGTEAPTSGDGYRKSDSIAGYGENGYAFGSNPDGSAIFKGTLKFFRYYQKVLSNEEVAWNRVVDEARYFNRVAPLPVTNVVVATAVAGANGTEPAGCYAVDGLHTFTAPATVTVSGTNYVCTGYTVETRNGDDWSAPVFHKTAIFQPCAYRVTTDDCVRLTWQWAKAAGLANLGYDVSHYVWDGLEVFYDGICNQGTNVAHSYTATNWVNLGSVGSDNDMFVQRLRIDGKAWVDVPDLSTVGVNDPGYWTANGFTMKGTSRFRCNAPGGFDVGTSYSLQMLVDAKASDQVNSKYAYLLGAQQDQFALRLSPTNGKLFFRYESGTNNSPFMVGGTYDYVTAIMRDTGKQTIFSGTAEPTSGDGYRADPACGYSDTGFAFGGYSKTGVDNLFVGTIKNFRQYNRALSAAEVAQNRKVDNWRYFGIPDVTNVVVQSTVPYLRGDEPDGPYAVDGSHVFSAPATVTAKGIDYACDGYTVETWGPLGDEGDGWSAATHHTGNTYAYTTSAGKVRLTWKWKATHGLRTAADYSFDDYSQAGIVWHFDGIYNQGVDVARSTTATTWKNLAPNPVTGQIFIQRLNSNSNGYANNDSTILGSLIETDGNWTENDKGFTMKGASRWRGIGRVGPVANWTIQSLVDANVNDIANEIEYVVSASWSNFATVLRKTGNGPVPNSFHFNAQDAQNVNTRPYFQDASGKYDYATAILDSSDRTAKMFRGVTPPTGGGIADGYYQYASIIPYKDNNFGIGAPAGSYDQFFIGTLKNIRYYDRVLTEEELIRNRNADAARYFGELGVTNLVVEANGFTADPPAGAYFVEGSYEFSAGEGSEGTPTGYKLQAWDEANGEWGAPQTVDGLTYRHDVTASASMVKLTWHKNQPFVLVIK